MAANPLIGGYRWSDLPRLCGLAIAFAGLVWLTLRWFSTAGDLVALVWAPSGLALAAALLWGKRFWLGVTLGAFVLNLFSGPQPLVALGFALGHAVEILVAVWLLERGGGFDIRLERSRDYLELLLAAAVSGLAGALWGAVVMLVAGIADVAGALAALPRWWQGDALGMALVTPFLLVWSRPPGLARTLLRRLEAVALIGISMAAGYWVFLAGSIGDIEGHVPRLYLMFALLPWAALRFGRHGASLLIMAVAVMAGIGVVTGHADFGPAGSLVAYYNLWLYLLVLSVVGYLLALTLKQMRGAELAARAAQAETAQALAEAERTGRTLQQALDAQRAIELELVEQKAFLETVLENEPECVKLVSADGRLLQMNMAGLTMLEVDSLAEAQSLGLAAFVHPEDRRAFAELHRRACAGERGHLAFRIIGRRGSRRWLETQAVPFRHLRSGPAMLAVTRDISARKQAELREALQAQAMTLIATGAPLPEVLDRIAREVESLLPGALCSILLLDADGRHVRHAAGPSLPEFFNIAVDGQPVGPAAGSCGTAIWRRERVVVGDIASDPLWRDYRDLAARAELAACWSEPILAGDQRVLGSFAVYYREPRLPSPEELHLIAGIARLVAVAIERCRAERELRDSEQRYQRVVDNINDALLVDDVDGRIVYANDRFLELFGWRREQLPGLGFEDCIAPEYRAELRDRHDRRMRGEEVPDEFEFEGVRSDGQRMWLEVRVSRMIVDGQATGTQSLIRDITEQKRSQALIWQQANFDELTGLPNRRMLRDRLEQEIKKARREQYALAVLLIDLDRFKEVNDTLGHDAGDQLLVEAAQRIRACVRDSDTVARLGGDEFVVVAADLEEHAGIDAVAQHIIDALAAPFTIKGEQSFVSASIGIALYPDDAAGIDDLLKHADQAMYVAKDGGRNRFSYFTPALQVAAITRLRLTNDLRRALGNGEFRCFFQPVVDFASGRIVKAEALIRWQHPQRGMVSPADFIPLAESSGLVFAIGDWMFQQAAFWAKRWRSQIDADFQVSVNQSPLEFQREGDRHLEWIASLREQGLPGQAIVLEITEGLLLDASSAVNSKLIGLRDAGIQVALDDFGTGYSSLAYLKQFDIDYLKIDQRFTRNLAPGSSDMALTEAIIVMAHKLGMRVIAEGVETEAQRELLVAAGCDFGQGWLVGRPLPAMDFDALLAGQGVLSRIAL